MLSGTKTHQWICALVTAAKHTGVQIESIINVTETLIKSILGVYFLSEYLCQSKRPCVLTQIGINTWLLHNFVRISYFCLMASLPIYNKFRYIWLHASQTPPNHDVLFQGALCTQCLPYCILMIPSFQYVVLEHHRNQYTGLRNDASFYCVGPMYVT